MRLVDNPDAVGAVGHITPRLVVKSIQERIARRLAPERLCVFDPLYGEADMGVYATWPATRFLSSLYRDAARSAMRGLFPGGFGGWPVGGGSDLTAQMVPAGCLMLTSALISSECPLTGTLFEVTSAGFFRKAFAFAAVLTDLVLAIWIALCMFEEGRSQTCIPLGRMRLFCFRLRAVEYIRGSVAPSGL
jgi:hypothetical protein